MTRTDILNYLIRKIDAKSYLEIGIRELDGNFNKIQCAKKVGVDPNPQDPIILGITSDEFFAQNTSTFDVIFIDGLHIADQVERDILNALEILNEGGYIVCHDMSPTTEEMQRVPEASVSGPWTGDCWKAWVKLRTERGDLRMVVVDTDFGVGIIQKGKQELLTLENIFLSYDRLVENRKEWLNLITVTDFL